MAKFPDSAWWTEYQTVLNSDEEWLDSARYFEGRIEFQHDHGSATIAVFGGTVVSAQPEASALGADVIIAAPDTEWQRLLADQTDWFEGTSPGLGQFSLRGNAVAALRNVKVMALAFEAMKRVGSPARAAVSYSPDPKPSGKQTKGHYIDIDGLRIFYEEAGEGQPVVCFHAACQDTLMYRHVLDGLSDEYRVIAIDAPAHGKSLEPANGPFQSLTRHAEFNEKVMEKLGLIKPVIIGCSMAGNLVLELGARRPEAYSAIISSEGADFTPTVSQFLLDMLMLNGPQILEGWSKSMTGKRTPPDRAREVVWQLRRTCPEVMRGDLTGYASFDKRDVVGNIKSPVLLLRGDADWLVSQKQVEETSSRIPGSKIAVLKQTGHYPMIENPYEFNEAVRSFLHEAGIKSK